jgi:hypothetical protein
MNNYRVNNIVITIVIILISLSLSMTNLTITQLSKVFGQSTSMVKITKDLTNSYLISSGSSKIGTFDTTYTISGNTDIIKKEQKIILSTIKEDFNNSPIAGYIKTSLAPAQQQQLKQPTLSNPFTNKATINQKIETEIGSALSSVGNTNTAKISIQCNFGMELSEWKCKGHGLVG